jgi:hypothetical protein
MRPTTLERMLMLPSHRATLFKADITFNFVPVVYYNTTWWQHLHIWLIIFMLPSHRATDFTFNFVPVVHYNTTWWQHLPSKLIVCCTMICYRLSRPRVPHAHCFSAPFVSIIAPWGEIILITGDCEWTLGLQSQHGQAKSGQAIMFSMCNLNYSSTTYSNCKTFIWPIIVSLLKTIISRWVCFIWSLYNGGWSLHMSAPPSVWQDYIIYSYMYMYITLTLHSRMGAREQDYWHNTGSIINCLFHSFNLSDIVSTSGSTYFLGSLGVSLSCSLPWYVYNHGGIIENRTHKL